MGGGQEGGGLRHRPEGRPTGAPFLSRTYAICRRARIRPTCSSAPGPAASSREVWTAGSATESTIALLREPRAALIAAAVSGQIDVGAAV